VSDGGPTAEDFAAAARELALQRARGTGPWSRLGCSLGCGLLVAGPILALAGLLRPAGEVGAAVGALLLALVLVVVFRSGAAIARGTAALLPRPEAALAAAIAASPDAAGWLVLRVRSQPAGPLAWLAVTFGADDGGHADARWLPGSRGAQTPGGRRVLPLAPERARALAGRLRTTLGPPPAVPAPIDVRDGAPFDVAACWSGGAPHLVSGNLSATRPPEGDLWAELVEAGLALIDEARPASA
jgi:hypothetical protein